MPTTISDDPHEDANNLDDDALFEAFLDAGIAQTGGAPEAESGDGIPDWPPVRMRTVALPIDVATLAWFKGNHVDWRVAAQTEAVRDHPIAD